MVIRRAICINNLRTIKNLTQNPIALTQSIASTPFRSLLDSSILPRPVSSSASVFPEEAAETQRSTNVERKKKPLNVYFKEAVGLLEKSETSESDCVGENAKLKKKLKKLEVELRSLNYKRKDEKGNTKKNKLKNEAKPVVSLAGLFGKTSESVVSPRAMDLTPLKKENAEVYKKLSPDMEVFLKYLYDKGYFKGSNFLPRRGFDITCFENSYARDFVKHAAQQFGKDNQEIAKWLSGSDLKKIALFGCPNLSKAAVFAAKRLRTFFNIQENFVCSKCSLKASCNFVNQSVWKSGTKNLNLDGVMKVITLYALESVPEQLVVPDEIKSSVSQLLKEVTRLSETVPSGDSALDLQQVIPNKSFQAANQKEERLH